MVVIDDNVKRVMERGDLDAEEKLILIDLLMRQPEPEKEIEEGGYGATVARQHKAVVPATDIAERTGLSERTVRGRLSKLEQRGFVEKVSGKGRTGNRYLVKFPKRLRKEQKEQPEQGIPKQF
jgi:DNA-binding MarR family transcriptional regulator